MNAVRPAIVLQKNVILPLAAPVQVKHRRSRFWAYRDHEGHWRDFLSRRALHGKVKIVRPDFLNLPCSGIPVLGQSC
jgi:hypothetical protein